MKAGRCLSDNIRGYTVAAAAAAAGGGGGRSSAAYYARACTSYRSEGCYIIMQQQLPRLQCSR
jgi:hypothetical protein